MKTLTVFLSIITIFLLICSIVSAKTVNFVNGIAKINENGGIIKVTIKTTNYYPGFPYSNGFIWGADEYEKPRLLITDIEILLKDTKIFVPLSAYCDLANPSQVELKVINHNSFSLIIYGGDAGVSYITELIFKDQKIKSRKVAHGEFPNEAWEKTEYHFIEDKGQ